MAKKQEKELVKGAAVEPEKEKAVIEVPASQSQGYQDQGYKVISVKGLGKNKVHTLEKQ